MTAAVAGAETGHGIRRLTPVAFMASTKMRVDSKKSVVPSKMTRGEKSTPSVLDHHLDLRKSALDGAAIERIARYIIEVASWIGMLAAERASARTLWPERSAALTVSSPMPRLAPMTRTFAMGSFPESYVGQ